ncbi:SPOSA6832_02693 [Sporobolomyces salmonicolor]|uniref:SPOSA6832_02693-mRNA-1:cds n=1 Tax=Sporidiobolus salmonicolor TaxID=5005 RepID=A0A0D6EM48_SPOSA|nr:SPOSA6832_02693 [Sporobolomyces salmonicolor]
MAPSVSLSSVTSVDLLILGLGWTGTFLAPHLKSSHPSLSYAATTRDGRDGTLAWTWDPEQEGAAQYETLPRAKTVVVVFPIKGEGGSRRLVEGYEEAVGGRVRWIQLGSTGIFDGGPTLAATRAAVAKASSSSEKPPAPAEPLEWTTRHSLYDRTNARAIAEDELLSMHEETFVLNLSGLWVRRSLLSRFFLYSASGKKEELTESPGEQGGTRDPANWIPRIATSKAALEAKGSLHLIHGLDVSRAIIAVHLSPPSPSFSSQQQQQDKKEQTQPLLGRRYILTDLRVLDWFDLVSRYAPGPPSSSSHEETPPAALWVQQLMDEHNIRSLPRTPQELGRALDSREFWREFGLMPVRGGYERGRL